MNKSSLNKDKNEYFIYQFSENIFNILSGWGSKNAIDGKWMAIYLPSPTQIKTFKMN